MGFKAVWNGEVIAESENTVVVEGNHYFPPESIKQGYLQPSEQRSRCFWKGTASYYDIDVNGRQNMAGAWYYADPSPAAAEIRGHVAFWKGVKIIQSDEE